MVLIIILAGIIILAVFYGSSPRYGDDTEENLKRTPYQPSRKKNQSTINDEKSKNNKKKYLNPPIDIRSQTNNQTPKHKIELFDANEDYASSQKIIGEGDTNKEALSNLRKQKEQNKALDWRLELEELKEEFEYCKSKEAFADVFKLLDQLRDSLEDINDKKYITTEINKLINRKKIHQIDIKLDRKVVKKLPVKKTFRAKPKIIKKQFEYVPKQEERETNYIKVKSEITYCKKCGERLLIEIDYLDKLFTCKNCDGLYQLIFLKKFDNDDDIKSFFHVEDYYDLDDLIKNYDHIFDWSKNSLKLIRENNNRSNQLLNTNIPITYVEKDRYTYLRLELSEKEIENYFQRPAESFKQPIIYSKLPPRPKLPFKIIEFESKKNDLNQLTDNIDSNKSKFIKFEEIKADGSKVTGYKLKNELENNGQSNQIEIDLKEDTNKKTVLPKRLNKIRKLR